MYPPGTYGPGVAEETRRQNLFVGRICLSNSAKRVAADGSALKTEWTVQTTLWQRTTEQKLFESERYRIFAYRPRVTDRRTSPTDVVFTVTDEVTAEVWRLRYSRADVGKSFSQQEMTGRFMPAE